MAKRERTVGSCPSYHRRAAEEAGQRLRHLAKQERRREKSSPGANLGEDEMATIPPGYTLLGESDPDGTCVERFQARMARAAAAQDERNAREKAREFKCWGVLSLLTREEQEKQLLEQLRNVASYNHLVVAAQLAKLGSGAKEILKGIGIRHLPVLVVSPSLLEPPRIEVQAGNGDSQTVVIFMEVEDRFASQKYWVGSQPSPYLETFWKNRINIDTPPPFPIPPNSSSLRQHYLAFWLASESNQPIPFEAVFTCP